MKIWREKFRLHRRLEIGKVCGGGLVGEQRPISDVLGLQAGGGTTYSVFGENQQRVSR